MPGDGAPFCCVWFKSFLPTLLGFDWLPVTGVPMGMVGGTGPAFLFLVRRGQKMETLKVWSAFQRGWMLLQGSITMTVCCKPVTGRLRLAAERVAGHL